MRWKERTKTYWLDLAEPFRNAVKDLPEPYFVELTFVRSSKQQFDYNNISQVIFDSMKDYGWIKDDNTNHIKPYYGDPIILNGHEGGALILILKNKINHYGD